MKCTEHIRYNFLMHNLQMIHNTLCLCICAQIFPLVNNQITTNGASLLKK